MLTYAVWLLLGAWLGYGLPKMRTLPVRSASDFMGLGVWVLWFAALLLPSYVLGLTFVTAVFWIGCALGALLLMLTPSWVPEPPRRHKSRSVATAEHGVSD